MKINTHQEAIEETRGIPTPRAMLKGVLGMILNERDQQGGWGSTTYCTFMDQIFGHPEKQDYKPVLSRLWPDVRREYTHRVAGGVTLRGMLLVVRSVVPRPFNAQDCVAFTGDIKIGEVRAWPVTEVVPRGYYSQSATYVLSRLTSVVLFRQQRPRMVSTVSDDDSIAGEFDPKIIVSPYNSTFIDPAAVHQNLISIADLHGLVDTQKAKEIIQEPTVHLALA